MPVLRSCVDHGWGIVDLSAPGKVRSGKLKARGKPSGPKSGCVFSEDFCAHYDR